MPEYIPPPPSLPPGSNVWAYVRDSGGSDQEQSVNQQRQEIETYCQQWGLVLEHIFADIGKSAKSTKGRDEFNAMIDSITATDHPAGLLVWSLSRFARNIDDSTYYRAHLRRHSVVIHSLTEKIPEGLAGRIVESVHDYSNADYLEQQSKHIKRALEANVRNGFAPGGTAPRGYVAESVVLGKKRDGNPRAASRWIPDPDIFPLVQLAWKLRAAGKHYAEITKATGGKVYKSVACWSSFFRNKSYLGIGKCGEVEIPDHHEAAVSLDDWQRVQAICDDHASRLRGLSHPRRTRYPSLLSGLAYCAKCGAAIFHHIGTQKRPTNHYYICGKRDREHGLKSCDNPRVMGKTLDALVLDTVLSQILTPAYAEDLLDELQKQLSDTDTLIDDIKHKRYELNETKRAINNLLDLAETFGSGSAKDRLKQRETQRAVLETEIKNLETHKESSEIEITPEALAVVIATWRNDLLQAKQNNNVGALRALLARFINRIEIGDHHVCIWYTYPLEANCPIVKVPPRGASIITASRRFLVSQKLTKRDGLQLPRE